MNVNNNEFDEDMFKSEEFNNNNDDIFVSKEDIKQADNNNKIENTYSE